jgi:predicted transposase/invertase (TIGR01784 family)
MTPDNPAKRFSIVDVLCRDNYRRQFIIEILLEWSYSFSTWMKRIASETRVQQLKRKGEYAAPQTVYAPGILNENCCYWTEEFYHHYQVTHREDTDNEMELILIELQKFRAEGLADRKEAVKWLRFLKEVQEKASIPEDLPANEEIREALSLCKEEPFTTGEMAACEKYRDTIRVEKTLIHERFAEGLAKSRAEGWEESFLTKVVRNSVSRGLPTGQIQYITGLGEDRIREILRS